MFDEKAQLHTLEGVAAATLLLTVIIYAIDATSMTPLTSSTANAHIETELAVLGQDILNTLDYSEPGYSSNLKNDIITWDGKQYLWDGNEYIKNGGTEFLNNNLTAIFKKALIGQGIAHRVELRYLVNISNTTEPSAPHGMIDAGVPSDNAVVVSRVIVLQNTDCPDDCEEEEGMLIEDINPQTNLYNIVDVRLILWRT